MGFLLDFGANGGSRKSVCMCVYVCICVYMCVYVCICVYIASSIAEMAVRPYLCKRDKLAVDTLS